jgi:hydrogenase expression/formation protein HypE
MWEGAMATRGHWVLFPEKVVVNTEVRAACEVLDLDPLLLTNEGVMMVAVEESSAELALEILKSHRLTAESQIVGKVAGVSDVARVSSLSESIEIDIPYSSALGPLRLC